MARSIHPLWQSPGTSVNAVPGARLRGTLLVSLRPSQWTKNLLVFAGLLFGRRLFDVNAVIDAVAAFVIFARCRAPSIWLNDYRGPSNRSGAPAQGEAADRVRRAPGADALIAAIVIAAGALALAANLGTRFSGVAARVSGAPVSLHWSP